MNPICHLLALLGAHHIFHVSRIRVNVRYGGEFKSKRTAFAKYLVWCEYKKYTIITKFWTREYISTSEIILNGTEDSLTFDICIQHSEAGRHNSTVISCVIDLLDLSLVCYSELATFRNFVYVTVLRWKGGQWLTA